MKLLTTLAYFIKNQKDPLFKRSRNTLQDFPSLKVSATTDEKEAKNDHKDHKPITQMPSHHKNSQHYAKIGKEQLIEYRKKGMFSKLAQKSTLSQPPYDAPIIKQKQKDSTSPNDLPKIIRVALLPMELFSIHKERWQQFGPNNYKHLFKKLHFSCLHPETIHKFMDKKKNSPDLMLKEGILSHSVKDNGPLFLSKEQIINHKQWKQLIELILKKIKQIEDISTFNQYLPVFLTLQKEFSFIPAQIYQLVLTRNVQANFDKLNITHISNLIQFLKYKNKIKQHNQDKEKQENQQQSSKIQHFIQTIAQQIISHPQKYTKDDFLNVFIVINRRKMRMNILTQDILRKSETTILTYYHQFTFENIFTYMKVYIFFQPTPNRQLLSTLKIALEQKSCLESNIYSLLMLLHNIKARKLIFNNLQTKGSTLTISLDADALLFTIAKDISKCIFKLKSSHVIQFLDCCFHNEVKNSDILASISQQLVRHRQQIRLDIYGKALFKLYLLGQKSEILTNCVLEEYVNNYQRQIKLLDQSDVFKAPSTGEEEKNDKSLNFKQIHLQQCLIMVLWTFIQHFAQKLSISVNLQSLRSIIPTQLNSMDRLPIQLAQNINHMLKNYPQMPKITFTQLQYFPEGRLRDFYRNNFSKSQLQLLMWEEAHLTKNFVANYNTESKRYLAERWSSVCTYKQDDYIQFCIKFEQSLCKRNCFFDEKTSLPAQFIMKRKQVIKKMYINV